mmetsp:Transcript_853/g.1900  ORF Transcript_853/g.1900 Transcript_853/m.1900 type:complete len:107 (+) Transcript_853:503-823(+)
MPDYKRTKGTTETARLGTRGRGHRCGPSFMFGGGAATLLFVLSEPHYCTTRPFHKLRGGTSLKAEISKGAGYWKRERYPDGHNFNFCLPLSSTNYPSLSQFLKLIT